MAFIFNSLFGVDGVALADSIKNAAQASIRPLQHQITAQVLSRSGGARLLEDVNELWSHIQKGSSSESAYAIRSFLVKNFQSTHLYSETSQWLQTFIENVQYLPEILRESSLEDQGILGNNDNFEDLSDVIKDFIKSMKVLVTFEAANDIHEELLVPNFNVQPVTQNRPRNPARRYIGR